jgi:bifunctional DNA-binding transcriptional regulator/antitoxin component of YhaV-PrlF toxin-antitoxin module
MSEEERKLIKFSNYSLCVTLPKSVITKLKWKKGDIVAMRVDEDTKEIVISKNKIIDKVSDSKNLKITQGKSTFTEKTNEKARW